MTSLKKPSPLDFKTQYGLALDDTDDAIIVDLCAGGGGASTGLEMGLGRKVDLAIASAKLACLQVDSRGSPGTELEFVIMS
ncbi:hypothetical protein JMUB7492_27040 [Staphylococcus aureus]